MRPSPHEAGFSGHVKESKVTCRRVVRDHTNEMWDLKCDGPRADQGGDRQVQGREVPVFGWNLAQNHVSFLFGLPSSMGSPRTALSCATSERQGCATSKCRIMPSGRL